MSRVRRALRWLVAGPEQRWFDHRFWGLIHDHNWSTYQPPKAR